MTASLTRRGFVQSTVAAGAALAAASTAKARFAANDEVVVAIMGTNSRGAQLAKKFAATKGCRIAYICDVEDKAQANGLRAATEGGAATPEAVRDFRRTLDDRSVDALVIAAPDHWHAPATILACAAGKHVYVEKPASHNGQEGLWMIEAAAKHKRMVQMGNHRRSDPLIMATIDRVRSGEIGRVLFSRGWINSTRPSIGRGKKIEVPSSLDYALWQGPAPEVPYRDNLVHYNWHWFWHWGTGELGNNGIHAVDVCRWGLGVDWPTHVVCGGGRFHFDDDQETPDTQIATFHFGDKAINWEHRTWNVRGFENTLFGSAFYGEEGTIVIGGDEIAKFDRAGKEVERTSSKVSDQFHVENFVEAVRSGAKLNSQIAEGVKSTVLCQLGNIAYRTGRTIHFDGAKRHITGDADAAKLWSREYRQGWAPKV